MIQNDTELKRIQERVITFQQLLAQIRVTASPEEFPLVADSYRAEIERMQAEVMDYLMRPVASPQSALAA